MYYILSYKGASSRALASRPRKEGKSRRVSITTIVGGRTSARRKPYRNDTRKPSNRTRRRTHI
jgi:hypothetical protein